jgi:p-aminobenzoyl-glutamate transporter AbgT
MADTSAVVEYSIAGKPLLSKTDLKEKDINYENKSIFSLTHKIEHALPFDSITVVVVWNMLSLTIRQNRSINNNEKKTTYFIFLLIITRAIIKILHKWKP